MDEKDYIHEIVLKVFDTLTASIEHYQVEFVAFGNEIDRKFLELAKPYDKKKLLTSEQKYIYYDSMENVNKNYQGKLPLYFADT